MSQIKMVSLGCKSAKLKHVVCHRREVYMILKDPTRELHLSFSFKVEGYSYVVFATSENMKCFGCGAEGHLIRSCLERRGAKQPAPATSASPAARGEIPHQIDLIFPGCLIVLYRSSGCTVWGGWWWGTTASLSGKCCCWQGATAAGPARGHCWWGTA